MRNLQGFALTSRISPAAPLPGKADFEAALKTTIQGSVHVLEEGYKAGVRNAVVSTTSMASCPFGGPYGANDFNSATKEEAAVGCPWLTYVVEKVFGDKAVSRSKMPTRPWMSRCQLAGLYARKNAAG
ncbi:hypothetical protein CPB85DRAFT_542012 [Mucidula mucida]|nr:hypothetical protein CPB85DRAFT_542012 [Mucidula mucida]